MVAHPKINLRNVQPQCRRARRCLRNGCAVRNKAATSDAQHATSRNLIGYTAFAQHATSRNLIGYTALRNMQPHLYLYIYIYFTLMRNMQPHLYLYIYIYTLH